jgi:hypothetical protein
MDVGGHAAAWLHAVTGGPYHPVGPLLADAGYCSDANLTAAGPRRLIALSKACDHANVARPHHERVTARSSTTPKPPPSNPQIALGGVHHGPGRGD